jgi:hypothetical protein
VDANRSALSRFIRVKTDGSGSLSGQMARAGASDHGQAHRLFPRPQRRPRRSRAGVRGRTGSDEVEGGDHRAGLSRGLGVEKARGDKSLTRELVRAGVRQAYNMKMNLWSLDRRTAQYRCGDKVDAALFLKE